MTDRDARDDRVAEEEAAAARDAARIGGTAGDEDDFGPEMRPVYEAGGGVSEGFEQAEADLVDNAQHGDGHGDPLSDAFSPEAESDRGTAVYGSADGEHATEVVRDPDDPEGPQTGPGIAGER